MDASPELERRKLVRLRRRADLDVGAQRYEGASHYVVKDPLSLRYYRFDDRDHFLFQLMDGTRTLEEIRLAFEERFRPQRLRLEDLEAFGQLLLKAGLAYHELPQAGRQLYERRGKRRRMRWLQIVTNILYIELPLFDPDRLLGWLTTRLRWLLAPTFLVAGLAFMLAALLLVGTHFETFYARLPSSQEFFQFQNLLYLWLALGLVKVLHELGHGLACKALGGEAHDMGFLLLCLSPCLYLNVTDAWRLPDKKHRMLVGLAGIYVELLVAALATFVWWYAPGQPILVNLCLSIILVCSVNTLLFNGNPLLRYDGYFVLADWLEVPNLRERCNAFLKRVVLRDCLGVEMPPEPRMAWWRRMLFIAYAVASYIYGWVVTFGVLWFLSQFLRPYKLGAVSVMLAAASLASMIGWPLFRMGQALYRRGGRLPSMKPGRVALTSSALGFLLLAFLFLPLPISRVRQTVLVQPRPEAAQKVFVTLPGTLERLHIKDGQRVEQGDILAEFRSLELEIQLEEARSQHAIRVVQLQALRQQAAELTDVHEKSRVEIAIAQADGERKVLVRQLAVLQKTLGRLVLRAPRSGVLMGAPSVQEIGKLWDKDQATPFCTIGDPTRLRALVPVTPADYRLLKEDLGTLRNLPATLRVDGWAGKTWEGSLAPLPESEAQEVPLPLTTRGGGPLAIKPNSRSTALAPQEQHYLVAVDFVNAEHDGIWPGTLGQAKIHCRWRSAAWWTWRTISLTFDLGLV